MKISVDNFPIFLALLCSALAFVAYLVVGLAGRRGEESTVERIGKVAYYISVAAIAYASLNLLQALFSGQRYDIAYVFGNSGPKDELLYRISALWAGQEGSLLFWALVSGLIGLPLVLRLGRKAPYLLTFWASVQVFFLVILVVQDPFAKLPNFQPGMVGGGLNPLLKNPWMAIHPPVVFLGYALLAIPAAFAIQALIDGIGSRWVAVCFPWALAGWAALTAGLALGMIWSYEVLGWGGYWGWDPVENASLVPWLTATALVHGMLLQRYRGVMARGNVVLALATFLLVIYATFLTRSGVLADVSVHSFTDLGGYAYLLGFLIFFAGAALVITAARWKAVGVAANPIRVDSKEFITVLGVIALAIFAAVVLVGTSYPIFARGSIRAEFYNRAATPLAILIAALVAIAPVLRWGGRGRETVGSLAGAAAVLKAFAAAVVVAGVGGAVALASPATAHRIFSWLVPTGHRTYAVAVLFLLLLAALAVIALIVSAARALKSSPARAGAFAAHAGVALLVLGVAFSSSGTSQRLSLPSGGAPKPAYGYLFAYEGRKMVGEDKEIMAIAVRDARGGFEAPLTVQHSNRGMVRSPFIKSSLLGDLYISPVELRLTTIRPTVSMTEEGLMSRPVPIPGTSATVRLVGMQVESRAVSLEYSSPGHTHTVQVSKDKPASVDGFDFGFGGFVSTGRGMAHGEVGADIAVLGKGLPEKAVVEVSTKPLIWMVWAGCLLVLLGGTLAVFRRRSEAAKLAEGSGDGLLSDSNESGGQKVSDSRRRIRRGAKGRGSR